MTNGYRCLTLAAQLLGGLVISIHAVQAQDCADLGAGGQLPLLIDTALAERTQRLCNDGYASLNSGVMHEPLWSAEHLTEENLEQATRLGRVIKRFHPDERLPRRDRAELADYKSSGYSRGHLAPSGDAANREAEAATFSLANIVPQIARLNEGVWAKIEGDVRQLTRDDGQIYVVTGPAFRGQPFSIGPHHVRVPSSTWKAVFDPIRQGTGVYVCKNIVTPSCKIVSVRAMIHATGIDPFPALPDTIKQTPMALPRSFSVP